MLARTKTSTEVIVRNAPADMLAGFLQALTLGQGTTTEIAIFCDSLPYGGILIRGDRILGAYRPVASHVFDQRSTRALLRDFLLLNNEHYTFVAWHNVAN